jgi:hypothetical protein
MFNFFRKTISYKGKKYSHKDLDNLMEQWMDKNFNPPELEEIDKYAVKSLELTQSQLEGIEQVKMIRKASSWKSRQRKLRKEGKLTQNQINKLNELGMVWNPKDDIWEKSYKYFKDKGLVDPIEDWAKEQVNLLEKNELPEENLVRLKAADFPFKKITGYKFKLDYYQIIDMKQKLEEGKSLYVDKFFKEMSEKKKAKDIKLTKTQKNKINKLNLMTPEDFKSEIDKLFNREYKKERIQGFIKSRLDHYSDIYFESFRYLNGTFKTGKVLDGLEETVKFKCSDDVVIYTSEKGLNLLDKHMLSSGEYNDAQRFPPVNKLIMLYSRQKRGEDLKRIGKIIFKHPILKAIYSERINKILAKY